MEVLNLTVRTEPVEAEWQDENSKHTWKFKVRPAVESDRLKAALAVGLKTLDEAIEGSPGGALVSAEIAKRHLVSIVSVVNGSGELSMSFGGQDVRELDAEKLSQLFDAYGGLAGAVAGTARGHGIRLEQERGNSLPAPSSP